MATSGNYLPEITSSPSSASTSSGPTKRVNVVFSAEQFSKLQNLADIQHITLSDALRQAINLSTVLIMATKDQDTQILLKKGNAVQELKLVR